MVRAAALAGLLLGTPYLQAREVGTTPAPAAPKQAAGRFQPPSNAVLTSDSSPRALLNRYCVTCHNDKVRTGGLSLEMIDVDRVSSGTAPWEKVLRKVWSGTMPPAGSPRPDKGTLDAFVSWLETVLDRAAKDAPNPGRLAIHRLNRTEYANVIRDLLALEIEGSLLLPAEDAAHGFDNIAELLTVSPGLLERYLSAAKKISRLAVGDPTIRPTFETYRVSPDFVQDERVSEDLPFGSRGGIAIRHYFPLEGEYVIRIRMVTTRVTDERIKSPEPLEIRLDGARLALVKPDELPDRETNAGVQVAGFSAKAGTRLVGVTFWAATSAVEGLGPVRLARTGQGAKAGVERVEIGGPYHVSGPGDSLGSRQIFVCRPATNGDEESCAKKVLARLARRAYRRPVANEDVESLLAFYKAARSEGGTFDAGIQRALEGLLVSPDFLFRVESDGASVAPGVAYRVSDMDLASRLSFFLWSSIPDDELLQVAERRQLNNPAVLEQQVRRMVSDARASTLISNFGAQWLYLRNLRVVAPNLYAFPEFDDNLREAFRRETELFLESQLREDRRLTDLLTANYTFVNERLARHYRIPNIYGSHFRRVTLTGEARRGLLGQGSILTVTSHVTRTSPVLRGKWILENILGVPPPPPPPNVPDLPDSAEDGRPASVRERLEHHRRNPVCASCHARMDPLGFALENFDAIGAWRTSDAGSPIDVSGVLPDGTKVSGPADLGTKLLSRPEFLVTTVTERLLTYALGRGLEAYDMPAVRKIVREAAPSGYRWSSIILGIVKSTPFQMKLKESEP